MGGEVLPQSSDEEFLARITDFVSNYSKNSYEQAWPSSPSKTKERVSKKSSSSYNRNKTDKRPESLEKLRPDIPLPDSKEILNSEPAAQQEFDTSEVLSSTSTVEYLGQQDNNDDTTIQIAPPDVDGQVEDAIPPEESEFLNKVSSFVSQYSNS